MTKKNRGEATRPHADRAWLEQSYGAGISVLQSGLQRLEHRVGILIGRLPEPLPPQRRWQIVWKWARKTLVAGASILAYFATFRPFINPQLSIEIAHFDPRSPETTEYVVANNGPFSIVNIDVGCAPYFISGGGKGSLTTSRTDPKVIQRAGYYHADQLNEGERQTFQHVCALDSIRFDGPGLKDLDFAVIVSYRPLLNPWRQSFRVRFVGIQNQDGTWFLRQSGR